MTFVEKIAHYIREEKIPMEHLTIVLPSERVKKYLSSALYLEFGKPVLAPTMITMNQWVKSYSEHGVIDNTRALIQLFEIQLKVAETEEDRSFDEFISWGNTLLADFNEIDRYLLDAKQIFRNLADIKEIENWSFGEENLTPGQIRFMEFWDRLPGFYFDLDKQLTARGQCYMGRAYKFLTENIDLLFKEDENHQYLFAGFNALSPSETSIIKQIENYGRAHILSDADAFYLDKKSHEAGLFLRQLSANLDNKQMDFVQDVLQTKPLKVELIECAQNTGQVKVASTLLAKMSKEEIGETLLLLADETLITSVVKNLPKQVGKANITLGLPIRNTSVKTWVEILFSIQENKRRFKTQAVYFNDLQNLWSHPFVLASLSQEEKETLLNVEEEIVRYNRIFINASKVQIGENAKRILAEVTVDWEDDWVKATQLIRRLNRMIYKNLDEEFAFERAVLECFDQALIEFENLVIEGIPSMKIKSFKLLFNQHWSQKSIAYHGNPLKGLQIMGLLETRGLDFKRVIALGMNEGHLPPTNPIQTMIPMDLRRYNGMPTPRDKQGIFAHHFYRLLHHCEELYVTYCSADESIGSNEPSRYLMQMEMELAQINENISIKKKMYALDTPKELMVKEIVKTPEILNRLDDLFSASTSASMLKKYLTCPLDFYFRYVMDFGEEDSVEEEIEHSTFGTFIHDTLEELYTPFARFDKEGVKNIPAPKNITSFDIEAMLKRYPMILEKQFMIHFNNDKQAFTKGKNLLSYQMAIELTERFLKSEVKFLSEQTEPVFIEALEREYVSAIEVTVNGEQKKVRLRGFIDRIDSIGDRVRIIDYKSGKVKTDDVGLRVKDVTEEFIVESIGNKKHVLQLMLYAFLYHQNENVLAEPCIISFVSGNNEPFNIDLKKNTLDAVVEDFPRYIEMILNDVYDAEAPFTHQAKEMFSYCQYCD